MLQSADEGKREWGSVTILGQPPRAVGWRELAPSRDRSVPWATVPRRNLPTPAETCLNTGYPASLELHKIYQVLPDEDAAQDGDIRVIDESSEDYLYAAEYFVVIQLPQELQRALLRAS